VSLTGLLLKLPQALETDLRQRAGISHFEYLVISVLSESEGRTLPMGDLATLASSTPSRLTHTVERMEARGWISRRRSPDNARFTLARLTDEGFAFLADVAPGHVDRAETGVRRPRRRRRRAARTDRPTHPRAPRSGPPLAATRDATRLERRTHAWLATPPGSPTSAGPMNPLSADKGRQHYMRWTTPATGYCWMPSVRSRPRSTARSSISSTGNDGHRRRRAQTPT
jgi:DNA-binding MarR family transcriptional regulator